jgi:hypothetical protein
LGGGRGKTKAAKTAAQVLPTHVRHFDWPDCREFEEQSPEGRRPCLEVEIVPLGEQAEGNIPDADLCTPLKNQLAQVRTYHGSPGLYVLV